MPNSLRNAHNLLAGNSWLAPLSGTTLLRRYLESGSFAHTMHLSLSSSSPPMNK